jgi:hypothetical protein
MIAVKPHSFFVSSNSFFQRSRTAGPATPCHL